MALTPNDYTQVKFRPGADSDLEKALRERAELSTNSALSQVAKRDLERYYTLLRLSLPLPRFSRPEARLLVSALNGSRMNTETVHRIYVDIDEAREMAVQGINRDAFVARLRNLSRMECMAIVDAVERFWGGQYHKSEADTWECLKEVGLINE